MVSRWIDRIVAAPMENWITFIVVAASAAAVFVRLHPSKILSDTLPAGGDMGAHVWGPAYLRDNLLPNFRFRGWTQDWYAGFPAMHFYMILPYLLIVILDVVLPYGVAFKLIAVAGVVSLPVAAWAFGRLARLPFPLPAMLSVAGLAYVFDFNFTIYGGNVASTLAGEFAFSLALSFALVFLGLVVAGLDTGRYRGWAAVFLALTALSHLIPLLFAVGGAVIIVAVRGYHRLPALVGRTQTLLVTIAGFMLVAATVRVSSSAIVRLAVVLMLIGVLLAVEFRRTWWALTTGAAGLLLTAFWLLPFVARRGYMNDMGWGKINDVRHYLFSPELIPGDGTYLSTGWLLALAGAGVVLGILHWDRIAMAWAGIAAAAAMAFVFWPQNRLWNARFLGFWYLALYMLAAMGTFFIARAVAVELRTRLRDRPDWPLLERVFGWARLALPVAVLALGYGWVALHLGVLPGGSRTSDGGYAWGPLRVGSGDMNFVSGWANWNFSGYEKKAAYPEYYSLITTMKQVGAEQGCGRAMWEFGRTQLDQYGTPMAPMLLPHFSDGCIGSMEGLYFESTPTVPYHFLLQSELSAEPSRPMRDIPYSDFDIDKGIEHMRMMGVTYYLAFSDQARQAASERPEDLVAVAFSDPWVVYRLTDTAVVAPLAFEPVVAEGIGQAGREWTDPGVAWFNDPSAWDVPFTADGPPEWARIAPPGSSEAAVAGAEVIDSAPRHALAPVQVSNVEIEDQSVSFDVDRTGVPVMVRVSYFPNWSVEGAEGPYRASPNFMVVIPTSEHVVLRYGDTPVEYAGYGLTILGLLILIGFARGGELRIRRRIEGGDPEFWDPESTFASQEVEGSTELPGVTSRTP